MLAVGEVEVLRSCPVDRDCGSNLLEDRWGDDVDGHFVWLPCTAVLRLGRERRRLVGFVAGRQGMEGQIVEVRSTFDGPCGIVVLGTPSLLLKLNESLPDQLSGRRRISSSVILPAAEEEKGWKKGGEGQR